MTASRFGNSVVAPVSCPSCRASNVRDLGALPETLTFAGRNVDAVRYARLYSCLACGLKFRHPVLTRAQYDELYDNEHTAVWPDASPDRNDWGLVAAYLAKHAAAGASVLDFGCYTGGLLGMLGPRYARTAVEVNAEARKVASERTGAEILAALEDVGADRKFDFITAVDVVEHFADPGEILEALLRITNDGGTLIVTTGDADAVLWKLAGRRWWYCFFPEHLAFISERWLRAWLSQDGRRAKLIAVERFAYFRLSALRYARQACQTILYLASPSAYTWLVRFIRRIWGRGPSENAPGAGLTKDHLFLAIRKSS